MSGTSLFDGGEVGYGGYRPLFTAMQWQELEHQARIYKYMVAGLPVPLDLVVPIRQSLEALSARFFSYPSLGCFSYYGKKFDPEPGRCRRTDGKKWRCSKEAHPDSKYCERHMHRGRNRSRKPVESSQNTSHALSTTTSQVTNTNYLISSGGSFQNIPLYSVATSESSYLGGNNITKLQKEPISSEFSCTHGLNPEADGLSSNTGTGTWRLVPSQVNSTNFLKRRSDDSHLLNPNSVQENMATRHGFGPVIGTTTARKWRLEQNCLLSSEIGSPKHEQQQHSVQPFFSKWPTTKEPWFGLDGDNDELNKNVFSSTQLSISIPRSSSDFS